jgi:hypothetical protein
MNSLPLRKSLGVGAVGPGFPALLGVGATYKKYKKYEKYENYEKAPGTLCEQGGYGVPFGKGGFRGIYDLAFSMRPRRCFNQSLSS